jgi:hypothetical protein
MAEILQNWIFAKVPVPFQLPILGSFRHVSWDGSPNPASTPVPPGWSNKLGVIIHPEQAVLKFLAGFGAGWLCLAWTGYLLLAEYLFSSAS